MALGSFPVIDGSLDFRRSFQANRGPSDRARLGETGDAELCVDVLQVLVDSAWCNTHRGGRLGWGLVQGNPAQGVGLSGGETESAQRHDAQLSRSTFEQQHLAPVLAATRQQAHEHALLAAAQHEWRRGRAWAAVL